MKDSHLSLFIVDVPWKKNELIKSLDLLFENAAEIE